MNKTNSSSGSSRLICPSCGLKTKTLYGWGKAICLACKHGWNRK